MDLFLYLALCFYCFFPCICTYFPILLFEDLFYLSIRIRGREWEREQAREIFHLLIHSPNSHNGQSPAFELGTERISKKLWNLTVKSREGRNVKKLFLLWMEKVKKWLTRRGRSNEQVKTEFWSGITILVNVQQQILAKLALLHNSVVVEVKKKGVWTGRKELALFLMV